MAERDPDRDPNPGPNPSPDLGVEEEVEEGAVVDAARAHVLHGHVVVRVLRAPGGSLALGLGLGLGQGSGQGSGQGWVRLRVIARALTQP